MNPRSLVRAFARTRLASAFITLFALAAFTFAQSVIPQYPSNQAGRVLTSGYANWSVKTLNAVSAAANSVTLDTCFVPVGSNNRFAPFASIFNANVPLIVVDGANTETITVTSVTAPTAAGPSAINPINCAITATFANAHSLGVRIVSGDSGFMEAVTDAVALSTSTVTVDNYSGVTPAVIAAATVVGIPGNMAVEYLKPDGTTQRWLITPNVLTALATPAVRVGTAATGCTGTNTVCDGTAVGTWTNIPIFFCVTYVDALGEESPCSTTAHYTTAGSLAINMLSPAASTGAVGWRAYIGASYATAYQIPITSANCVLTTLETVLNACAIGANGVFPTPTTHTQIPPQAGGVAAAYNPNTIGRTVMGFQPGTGTAGINHNPGPFTASVALTAGQSGVLGTVALPAGFLNYIGRSVSFTGKVAYTPTTGGTAPEIAIEIGDITDFSTGTPLIVCTLLETHTTTTVAYSVDFTCRWDTNATGATGSIMPSGFLVDGTQAGTTAAIAAPEQATGAITADVLDQDSVFVVFLQTSSAETTGPRLLDFHIVEN